MLETYAQYSYFVCSQLRKPIKMEGEAKMACSSAAVTSRFDALPDELVVKIIQLAAWIDFE